MSEQLVQLKDASGNLIHPVISAGHFDKKLVEAKFDANKQSVSLTATVPEGWKFLCWVGFASYGWAGSIYAAWPFNQTSMIWTPNLVTYEKNFYGFYILYR